MKSQDLEKLGLNRNEARVYLGLLQLKKASAANLVKIVGVHRNIIYDNLEKLIEKGLVSFINEGGKKEFIAENTNAIINFFEVQKQKLDEDINDAKKLIPDIKRLIGCLEIEQEASLFRGINGVKRILEMVLESKEYWVIGVSNASIEIIGKTYWDSV